MSGEAVRWGSKNFINTVRREVSAVNQERLYIQLRGLPRTALPADVQRAVKRQGAKGIKEVTINYERFSPTGGAYLTLTSPDVLNHNLKNLTDTTIASLPITAASSPPPERIPLRGRGERGRMHAAERAIVFGNGPRAGMLSGGKNVVLWGFPGKLAATALQGYLQNFKLAGTEGGKKEFTRIQLSNPYQFSRVAKYLVRMSSEAEAHRMVRVLHMTYFEPEVHNQKYLIRARIIY